MSWDHATKHQNELLKRKLGVGEAEGPSRLSQDLKTLRELLPHLDPRFKVGFVVTVVAFTSFVGMLFAR